MVFVFGYEKEGSFVLKRLGKVLAISFPFLASEFDRTICIVLVRCHFQTVKKMQIFEGSMKATKSGKIPTYLLEVKSLRTY